MIYSSNIYDIVDGEWAVVAKCSVDTRADLLMGFYIETLDHDFFVKNRVNKQDFLKYCTEKIVHDLVSPLADWYSEDIFHNAPEDVVHRDEYKVPLTEKIRNNRMPYNERGD